MNCDNLNKWILVSLGLGFIGDVLALFIELVDQRCEKKAETEKKRSDENISKELKELRESSNRLTKENKELRRALIEIRKCLHKSRTGKIDKTKLSFLGQYKNISK
ncbi:MAG: hypothetical protein H6Q70_2522 [Firmicutes bacterium]|nr:hypothetical protein [Bacillota bacterium]